MASDSIPNGTTNSPKIDCDATKSEEEVPVGSISATKNLFQSTKDDDDNWTWTDKYPEDAEEAAENEETLKFAVIVRSVKSNDSRKKLEAHSIIVQSPWLKTALGEILRDYPGVACELSRLIFEAPFNPFVHRWAEFIAYMKRTDLDTTTKEHLDVLHGILVYEIGDLVKAFEDYVLKGVISYEHLWMIFQPGGTIVSAYKGPLSAFEIDETEYMATQCGKFLRLKADCVDYDGKNFGRYTEQIDVPQFVGTKKISSLKAFPLSFHEDKEAVRSALIQRGEIFESLAGHHFKAYEGSAITWDREGNEVTTQVSGRIVIDIDSFNRYSPYFVRGLSDWKAKDLDQFAHQKELSGASQDDTLKLTPHHHMLARSRTRGYSMSQKRWLDFFVEQVHEVVFNSNAFEKLVLREDQKELILSFSQSQLEGSTFDDIIDGKGKGIICLLSGPPGVGKTLTAEAVAENLRVPLHSLTSGDLGSDPWDVEKGLSQILDLVARWKAILLLDECDVFLEARSTHDLERNSVVSIFLRTLERYEGIMFMTTNRVGNMDAAFQSRIHVSIEYPDLTRESRRQIWANFVPAGRTELTDGDLDELSELSLNGRQIKNILKTAQLLASWKKVALKKVFIDTVLAMEMRRPVVHA